MPAELAEDGRVIEFVASLLERLGDHAYGAAQRLREWHYDRHAEELFACLDCGTDTLAVGDYYAVKDDVWSHAGGDDGMLCVLCLEARLGRRLSTFDFADAPVNFNYQTERVRSRVLGRGERCQS
jgi:hypothetical protein